MSNLSERIAKLKELEAEAERLAGGSAVVSIAVADAHTLAGAIIEELEAENEELKQEFVGKFETFMPRILDACKRKSVADSAEYAYPRGGTLVTGPSIRLAEVIAQNYQNLAFGVRELSNKNGESLVQSYCFDLETNVRSEKVFTVPHIRYSKKKGNVKLTDPRDIYEMVANQAARRGGGREENLFIASVRDKNR